MPTSYVDDCLVNVSEDGMTEDLWNLVNDDLGKLKQLKIESDKERNLLFYLENFMDELLEEFQASSADKDKVISAVFNYLRNKKNVDLTDIRHAVLLILRKQKKMAYPNVQGIGPGNLRPERNITRWIKALGDIYAAVNSGETKDGATIRITEGWDPMEKTDFLSWIRYYEEESHEKYQLERTAAPYQIPTPSTTSKEEEVPPRGPGRPRKTRKTLQQTKMSLISRLDSATRLLREFAGVWPDDVWHRLAQTLADLQREVIPLRTVATISDRIIRTAGVWDRDGFPEGAEFLRKIAEEPDDVASEIEKALTGREYDTKPKGKKGPPMDMPDLPPMEELSPETEEGMPPAGVEEEMPPPPEMPPVEEEAPKETETLSVSEEDNPFEGKNVQDVLNILEPLEQKLSEREFVHSLSKADMMLDELNIASHFPELAESLSKALELNLYISSRLKSVISKLKGGMGNKKPKPSAPPVEMEELIESPTESPAASAEQEMFEIEEGEATPPKKE